MKDLITLIRRKEFGRAKKLLQKELSKKPDDVYLLTQMANVLWNLGRDKAALSYADKAQLADSNYPLMLFTRGRILWSLEQHSESIKMWDKLLCAELSDIAEQGWGDRWAKSIVNDALFYKADSLHCIYRSKEAKVLMEEHMANRRKGQESDFTIKEAKVFLRALTYCSGKRQTFVSQRDGSFVSASTIEPSLRVYECSGVHLKTSFFHFYRFNPVKTRPKTGRRLCTPCKTFPQN